MTVKWLGNEEEVHLFINICENNCLSLHRPSFAPETLVLQHLFIFF